jgi:hypothetical protein
VHCGKLLDHLVGCRQQYRRDVDAENSTNGACCNNFNKLRGLSGLERGTVVGLLEGKIVGIRG